MKSELAAILAGLALGGGVVAESACSPTVVDSTSTTACSNQCSVAPCAAPGCSTTVAPCATTGCSVTTTGSTVSCSTVTACAVTDCAITACAITTTSTSTTTDVPPHP